MSNRTDNTYHPNSPIRQTIEILKQVERDFYHQPTDTGCEGVEWGARVMQEYNQIVRDITGVDPHWAESV